MARLLLKRTLNGFVPADEASAEAARRFEIGQTYKGDVVKPRNLKTHRRYWALVDLIYQNSDQFKSKDQVHQYLKIRAGHSTTIISKSTGELFHVADSISFDTLDDIQFYEVYKRMLDVVVQDILPGVQVDAVQYEIEKLCGVAA
jgi:hypothetical protein